jgi:predicted metalloprotease with PDZ domain
MTKLYLEYARKGKGLSEEDYIHELLAFGGDEAMEIVENHLYGTKDFRPLLDVALSLVGLQIIQEENPDFLAASLGIKGLFSKTGFEIKTVEEDSVADTCKIAVGDCILEVDGSPITKDLLISLSAKESTIFKVKRRFETINLEISLLDKSHYQINKIIALESVTIEQEMLFGKWLN